MFETNRFIIGCSRHLFIAIDGLGVGCRTISVPCHHHHYRPLCSVSIAKSFEFRGIARTHECYSAHFYFELKSVERNTCARKFHLIQHFFALCVSFASCIAETTIESSRSMPRATRHHSSIQMHCILVARFSFGFSVYSVMHSFFLLQLSSFHSYFIVERMHTARARTHRHYTTGRMQ